MHGGRFSYGKKWREEIERELDAADWLIFLATGQEKDWGFCLFECGFFSRMIDRPDGRRRLLKTFCRPKDDVHPALQAFNALRISEDEVVKLLREIYVDAPYALKPDLGHDEMARTAREIVDPLRGPRSDRAALRTSRPASPSS